MLKEKGFTLIELLVVISIIGLLSSVVMASVSAARQQGTIAAGQTFDRHTYGAFNDDLVLDWDFNSDTGLGFIIKDVSGRGNDLGVFPPVDTILRSTPNAFKSGRVLEIDGSETFPKSASFVTGIKDRPTGDFSISFWLYPTTNEATDYLSFYSPLGVNGGWKFAYQDLTNGFVFTFFSGSGRTVVLNNTIPFNRWSQITAVCNAGKLGVYVNGKLVAQNPGPVTCLFAPDPSLPTAPRVLSMSGAFEYFLDNIRIYRRALPLSFIQEQYLADVSEFELLAKKMER